MSEHDWLRDPDWPRVITEADWKPGLPPPIEALQERYRPEDGWTIEYATHMERDDAVAGGWRTFPIAIARLPGQQTLMFFPRGSGPVIKRLRDARAVGR